MNAAFERSAIPEHAWKKVILFNGKQRNIRQENKIRLKVNSRGYSYKIIAGRAMDPDANGAYHS